MSNVIDFLERMGRDAGLRYGARAEVELALGNEGIQPAFQELILAGDGMKLADVLGKGVMCCLLFPVKEDEETEEGGEDEAPSRDDDVASRTGFLASSCAG